MILGVVVGSALGALHLFLFHKALQALTAREGSGLVGRSWALVAGGRLVLTTLVGATAIRIGVSPLGLAAGLLLALSGGRVGTWLAHRPKKASKEISA